MLAITLSIAMLFVMAAAGPTSLISKKMHSQDNRFPSTYIQKALSIEPVGKPGSGGGQPPTMVSWLDPLKSKNFSRC